MQRTADVVVVGAGVMGASVAFHLARAGVRRVLVLEKTGIAAGATGKSAGFIRMHYTNEPEARMAIASFPIFQRWADAVGGDCGFTRTGFVMTVQPGDADALRANVAMLQRLGAKTEVLTAADLKAVPRRWRRTTSAWRPTSRRAATATRWPRRGPSSSGRRPSARASRWAPRCWRSASARAASPG